MSAGHTPGPWIICVQDDDPDREFTIFAEAQLKNGIISADAWDDSIATAGLNHANYAANARLIAAAPELLSELKAHQQALSMLLDALEIDAEGACFNFKAGDGSLIAKITFAELQSRSVAAINKATRATP